MKSRSLRYVWAGVSAMAIGAPAGARPPEFSGEIEQFFVSGGFGDSPKTRDRFTRFTGTADWGNLQVRASRWYYPFCNWFDLDESFLAYDAQSFKVTAGRFIIPFGQAEWSDQWYSGIVFLPLIEFMTYDNVRFLERTSSGVKLESNLGAHSLKMSFTNSDPQYQKMMPERLDRAALRWTYFNKGFTFGASYFGDAKNIGRDVQMVSADVRWSAPQWIVRAEALAYQSQLSKADGFYIDLYHRPKGWSDVTFVSRFERMHMKSELSQYTLETTTLGAKVRLPLDFSGSANYTLGPDMNRVFLGGNWSFQLSRSFRF